MRKLLTLLCAAGAALGPSGLSFPVDGSSGTTVARAGPEPCGASTGRRRGDVPALAPSHTVAERATPRREGRPVNFNNILIGTDEAPRLGEYYTKLFGKPGFEQGGYLGWMIGSGFLTIGPHDQVHGRNTEPGRLIWNIETSDVKGDFERLKAAGAIVVREPYEFEEMEGTWIATLADPDGNYFQLMTPMSV